MAIAARQVSIRVPYQTLLLCGVALGVYAWPVLPEVLIYDRLAVAHGEWWRLITGNLVHHDLRHLGYDIFAIAVAGALIEWREVVFYRTLLLTAGGTIGIVLYQVQPEIRFYGGLSGVATAATVYLCLCGLSDEAVWRRVCHGVLAATAVKIAYESVTGQSLTGMSHSSYFVPVPLAHSVGAVVAVAIFGISRAFRLRDQSAVTRIRHNVTKP